MAVLGMVSGMYRSSKAPKATSAVTPVPPPRKLVRHLLSPGRFFFLDNPWRFLPLSCELWQFSGEKNREADTIVHNINTFKDVTIKTCSKTLAALLTQDGYVVRNTQIARWTERTRISSFSKLYYYISSVLCQTRKLL